MSDPVARLNAALEGRYRIERKLGEGGMATVYLAEDLKHERKVALKVLKPELAAAIGAQRFLAEIKTTGNLRHPHILPLFDSGEADSYLFFVMPYVEGESLRVRLAREGQLPVDDAVRIAMRVAEALDYAHAHGVVHRDIKPENILFQDGNPFVADFGIALVTATAQAERLTETGLSIGTPSYMSPEQASSDSIIGDGTDTYALACVLYEMLTGAPPHAGRTAQAILANIITSEPPTVRDQRKTVPPHVDAAVRRALEKVPADRFRTTAAFGEALADESFRYGGDSGPARTAAGLRWVAAATVVLVGGGVAWAWRSRAETGEPVVVDRSIAVLPFDNRGAESEEYFSDGFADQLINALIRLPDVRVTNRASSFAFRRDTVDPQTIAERLGVANLVSGSIQQVAGRVLVTSQLIDAQSGFILWSDTYDRDLVDIIDVQEEVARAIAGAVGVELTGSTVARMASSTTGSTEAYDHYLRARQLFYQRTLESMQEAIRSYQLSIEADPGYVPAYGGLASVYAVAVTFGALPADSLYAAEGRALAYATHAIEIDPSDGEAYAARGYVSISPWADHDMGNRDFARAVELQPNSADALGWYGILLSASRRDAEGIARHEEAIRLDPVSPGRRMGFVNSALWARRPELALEQVQRAREIQPELGGVSTMYEALPLLLLGRTDDCLALDFRYTPALEAMCLDLAGRPDAGASLIDSLVAAWTSSNSYLEADGLAMYYAWTGDADRALLWMGTALETSPYSYSSSLWPPAVWDGVVASAGERFLLARDSLLAVARDRVTAEAERVEFP